MTINILISDIIPSCGSPGTEVLVRVPPNIVNVEPKSLRLKTVILKQNDMKINIKGGRILDNINYSSFSFVIPREIAVNGEFTINIILADNRCIRYRLYTSIKFPITISLPPIIENSLPSVVFSQTLNETLVTVTGQRLYSINREKGFYLEPLGLNLGVVESTNTWTILRLPEGISDIDGGCYHIGAFLKDGRPITSRASLIVLKNV
ncbi:TPA: hypothetical protein ACX6QX_002657 [Photobacterium damselae]